MWKGLVRLPLQVNAFPQMYDGLGTGAAPLHDSR